MFIRRCFRTKNGKRRAYSALVESSRTERAMPELLGVPATRVANNRLYRALDQLLPHKAKLEQHLQERLGELFDLENDLLLDDVTSTFFEGKAAGNPLAQRG